MRQGNYQEAANAYKEALKRTPDDDDTRYNLAYAQKKLAQQQQQQQNKDQNKDQKDQDKQKQDQKSKDQQDKDQQKKDDQEKDGQPKDDQDKKQQQQQQERINPQDAKRMLDAAQQQEKDVQDKVRRIMQPKPAAPAEKDW